MGSAVSGANTMFTQKAWNKAQFKVQQICGDIQVVTNEKTQLTAMYCEKKQAIMNEYSAKLKGSSAGGAFSQAGYLNGSSDVEQLLNRQKYELAPIENEEKRQLQICAEEESKLQAKKTRAETKAKMYEQMHEGLAKINEKNIQSEYKFRLGGMA